MINHILLICFSIIIYEFFAYIGFIEIIKSNLKIYHKILKLFNYKYVPDLRKEKLVLRYSKSLFASSIKIFLILTFILFFIYALTILSQSFLNLIISIFGIIELSVIVLIYNLLRKKINAKL